MITMGFCCFLKISIHVHLPTSSLCFAFILPIHFPWTIVAVPPGWYLMLDFVGTLDAMTIAELEMAFALVHMVSYISGLWELYPVSVSREMSTSMLLMVLRDSCR